MLHARDDYARIQDPSGKIPQDEPVFLLRSTDVFAPPIVALWAKAAATGGASPVIVKAAAAHAIAMVAYQLKHGAHVPDLPGHEPADNGIGPLSPEEARLIRDLRSSLRI